MSTLRINRFLAQAGFGSRRGVEALVRDGRVQINGRRITELGYQVDPEQDEVFVDGQLARLGGKGRMLALNKPVGVVCSMRRQDRRRCLADLITSQLAQGRLFHVGRLDVDSSGLILLGDDGDLANALLHPRHPVWKVYELRSTSELPPEAVDQIRSGGLPLDGRPLAPARIEALGSGSARYRLELREGRNRQIRRMFEHFRCRVVELHRVAFGPIRLGRLPSGSIRELDAAEVESLRQASGLIDED